MNYCMPELILSQQPLQAYARPKNLYPSSAKKQ